MPWIGTSSSTARAVRAEPTVSLEYPTTVSTRGAKPANAVIESITAHECRLRTVVFFDRHEVVEFDFEADGHPGIHACGRVLERVSKGPRFVYRVRLDRMPAAESDALARAVASTHRSQARERSHRRSLAQLPTTEALARSSQRVAADFAVQYRTARERFKAGKAGDVSNGGLSMTCGDALLPGEPLELCFSLPSDVLDVHPEETAVLDLRSRSVARTRSDLRRAFQPLTVRARVVSHRPLGDGAYAYGIAFVDLDAHAREELARYAQAVELLKRRRER